MAESTEVSFQVSLLSGVEGTVTGDAKEKVLDVKGKILEALKLEALPTFSLFLDSAEGKELEDDQSIEELSGRSVFAVVQSEPEWCTNKCFKQSYIRGRRCGMEETTEDADLKIYAGGTFKYVRKNHDHDAECGYNHDSHLTASGSWKVRWDASKKCEVLELSGEATRRETQRITRGCYDDYDPPSEKEDDDDESEEEEAGFGRENYDRTTTEAFQTTFSKADLTTADKGMHTRGGWKISPL